MNLKKKMEQNEITFESIQSEYRRRLDYYRTQEVALEAKIERLKRKQERNKYPHWTDHFVRPVMDELARLTPEIQWELKDKLNTFGLRGECPIFGKTASGRTVASPLLAITPPAHCTMTQAGLTVVSKRIRSAILTATIT